VAGERELEPAAERRAVDGGDDGLRARLDPGEEIGEARLAGGWPNSERSAPAGKVRPAAMMTMASTASSAAARSRKVASAARTGWESALTGGLSMVRSATRSSTL
jgi:hypothetical protein